LLGEFKAAPDIRQNGPAAGGGYVLPAGPKVKERRNPPAPPQFKCAPPDQLKSGAEWLLLTIAGKRWRRGDLRAVEPSTLLALRDAGPRCPRGGHGGPGTVPPSPRPLAQRWGRALKPGDADAGQPSGGDSCFLCKTESTKATGCR